MNKMAKGYGFYLFLVVILLAAVYFSGNYFSYTNKDYYGYSQYLNDLAERIAAQK